MSQSTANVGPKKGIGLQTGIARRTILQSTQGVRQPKPTPNQPLESVSQIPIFSSGQQYLAKGFSFTLINLQQVTTQDQIVVSAGAALWFQSSTLIAGGVGALTDTFNLAYDQEPNYIPMQLGQWIIGIPFQQLRVQITAAQALANSASTALLLSCQAYANEDGFRFGP